jgi:hypothetical protein
LVGFDHLVSFYDGSSQPFELVEKRNPSSGTEQGNDWLSHPFFGHPAYFFIRALYRKSFMELGDGPTGE